MLFNSPAFLFLFLPVTWAGWRLAIRSDNKDASLLWLIAASCVFYAWWDCRFLPLLLASSVVNYMVGTRLIGNPDKRVLVFGLAWNIFLLGYFKYAGFIAEITAQLMRWHVPAPDIILPLGISFFTFQKIAWLMDCYWQRVRSEEVCFTRFLLFVMYFPQLIAGPIVHHKQIIPQLTRRSPVPQPEDYAHGWVLLATGLFKKVVIADTLSAYVTPVFSNPQSAGILDAWTGAIAYTLQLYFDFSGYAEMAMGLSLFFGVRLPVNFNSPYRAGNIADFWRRWHITLGVFLREYLYIPIGGNRHGTLRMLLATAVVMLVAGVWHGAGWTFILWGALHGAYLVTYRVWQRSGLVMHAASGQLITLLAVIFGWVLFRANSVSDAVYIWGTMVGLHDNSLPPIYQSLVSLNAFKYSQFFSGIEIWVFLLLLMWAGKARNVHELLSRGFPCTWFSAAGVSFLLACSVFNLGKPTTFLYFQF